ncbi:hypothetical protein Pcinc_037270 [Petrolisthes cinctipes]|uniref:Amino acid transporter transmembrane domain-containing protein n=1 Tax=Petrolisthes cinctipes TaxID=88211 RepID=A0AAE1ELS6_PETCI|nr:hypothetical protein Pcinc_037270 [Petrolisthes cinctipes]
MGMGRPVGGITSPIKMVANIFVSFIGAGMLGLPFAYKESGIMEGALIMGLVGYLSVSAMLMLIDCKYAILTSGGRAGGRNIIMDTKVPLIPPDSSSGDEGEDDERHPPLPSTDLTYGDVGYYALGSSGKRLVDLAIIVSQIGFCCGYLIYLCKNLNLYIPRVSQRLWLFFLLPPLYCLTLLRHLNKLAIFSMFAQVSNVLALAVVFWFDFSHSEEVPFTPTEYSLQGFPFFFAVAIYCYEGAGMILSLEESMAEHVRHKFRSIFVLTMASLTLLYICFGVSGYLSFGPHTMDIITLNLPLGNSAVDFAAIVKICLGVSLFFTYPMMLFPVTHLLDKTFGLNAAPIRGNIMRLILVCMTGVVVMMVPNFALLMSLIGATCCTLLAFILPASFHLSIFRQRLTKRQRYFDIMLIILGGVGSVIALGDSLKRMNAAHDPLLDLNEFASGKNGSLHPQPHPHPHASTMAIPASPAESVSTLANRVTSDITQAKEKYGDADEDAKGKGKDAGESGKVDTKDSSEGNKSIEKEKTLKPTLGSPSTEGSSGMGKDLGKSTTSTKNVKVDSKITLPEKSNSASPQTSSIVIDNKVPVRQPNKTPLSSSDVQAVNEKAIPSPLHLGSLISKEMLLPASSVRSFRKNTTPSFKSANEKVSVVAEEGAVIKEGNSEQVQSASSQNLSHKVDETPLGSVEAVSSSPVPPINPKT